MLLWVSLSDFATGSLVLCKMEKYKIKTITEKNATNGAKYLIIDTYEGKKCASWNKDHHPILDRSLGKDIMLEIKTEGMYSNIEGVREMEQTTLPQQPVSRLGSYAEDRDSARNNSIVAQVIMKLAVECLGYEERSKVPNTEEYLCNAINVLTNCYHLAVLNLEMADRKKTT